MGPQISNLNASVRLTLVNDELQMACRTHKDPCSQFPKSGGLVESQGVKQPQEHWNVSEKGRGAGREWSNA